MVGWTYKLNILSVGRDTVQLQIREQVMKQLQELRPPAKSAKCSDHSKTNNVLEDASCSSGGKRALEEATGPSKTSEESSSQCSSSSDSDKKKKKKKKKDQKKKKKKKKKAWGIKST